MSGVLLSIFIIFFITLLIGLLQFAYGRRHLYKAAKKINGPPGWPILGNILEFAADPSLFLDKLMRFSEIYPNMTKLWFGHELIISVYTPEYLEILLNNPKALAKFDLFYKHLVPIMGHGVVTAPVPKWKRHRKTINPAFNQQILNKFMIIFSEQSDILVNQLKAFANNGEFNIIDAISRCALDITCETIMGVKVNIQTTKSNYHHVVHRLSEIVAERMTNFCYQLDLIFNHSKLYKEHEELRKIFIDFTKKVIEKKRNELKEVKEVEEKNSKRKAFLDLLLENPDFTEEELNEEVNTFMLGASDTTALTAGFIFIMLGMHPEVQAKVLNEILDVVGPERHVNLEDLPKLKYIENVIKETVRLFPGFPFVGRKLDDDINGMNGLTLPKGASVLINIISLHRCEKYWPDPLKFDPDRFLPENSAKRHPYSFLPFSAGPRNCIGYRFGIMFLQTMVAYVVRKYKVSTKYLNVNDVKLKWEVTLGNKHGFNVFLDSR